MKRIFFAFILAAFSGISHAGFDYVCLGNCADEGYPFLYCTSKCAVNDTPGNPAASVQQDRGVAPIAKEADVICVSDCVNAGLSFEQCVIRCKGDSIIPTPKPVQPQNQTTDDLPQNAAAQTRNSAEETRQIDDRCLNDCTGSGYSDQYCKKQCAF
ncbi:MAG: hypothetical protein HY799_08120 [Nitrosomonadales bacterium]|nr:hypothetical protein [Nitrosomonadales bacterium]